MSGHQFNDPVDEYAQLGAHMPVRRERQAQRHAVELPIGEQGNQLAARKMRLGHLLRQPKYAQAGREN
ncbi:hypothetical protein D3C84_454890 [compost metagenome]